MEIFVSRTKLMQYLEFLRLESIEKKKMVRVGVIDEITEHMETMEQKAISFEPEKSERITCLEPYFEGGRIGRDVYRCEKCQGRVDKHDRFCRDCGRRLVENVE